MARPFFLAFTDGWKCKMRPKAKIYHQWGAMCMFLEEGACFFRVPSSLSA